jgi:hypothetical protein
MAWLCRLGSMIRESISEERGMDKSRTHCGSSDRADGFNSDALAAYGADVTRHGWD